MSFKKVLKNIAYIITELFPVYSNTLYNKEFIEKFSNTEDMDKLNKAVRSLNEEKHSETIILSNKEEVTITIAA